MQRVDWDRPLVNRFWNGVSSTRLEEISFAKQAGNKLVEAIAEYLPPGTRCLDFGAGSGALVRILLEKGCLVAAYEPAVERQAQLMESDIARHPNFLGIASGDFRQKFDVVLVVEVIEHVLDSEMDGVIEQIKGFIRPGGLLIATTPNQEDLDLSSAYCPICGSFFHRWQHVRAFSAETLGALLAGKGFEQLRDHRVDFSTAAEIYEKHLALLREVRFMKWMGPLYLLAAPLIRRFIRHVLARRHGSNLRIGGQNQLIYVGRLS